MNNITTRYKKVFVFFMSLLLALLAGGTQTAQARLQACRTDPIVFLSDGTKIVITADIYTSESDLRDITYTLHGPHGTKVTKIVYMGKGFHFNETVIYHDDNTDGQYQTDTLVATYSAAVDVTVNSRLTVKSWSDYFDSVSMQGKSNDHVVINFASLIDH